MSLLGIRLIGKKCKLVQFLRRCMDYQDIFKRLDLAVNDMCGCWILIF